METGTVSNSAKPWFQTFLVIDLISSFKNIPEANSESVRDLLCIFPLLLYYPHLNDRYFFFSIGLVSSKTLNREVKLWHKVFVKTESEKSSHKMSFYFQNFPHCHSWYWKPPRYTPHKKSYLLRLKCHSNLNIRSECAVLSNFNLITRVKTI